jgi:flagellar hook protein FlgE
MISGVLQTGLAGMQSSAREMAKSANDIATAATSKPEEMVLSDLSDPIINLKIQQQVFDASAKVVEVADTTVGALLDIKA